jgi:hypothetical protein
LEASEFAGVAEDNDCSVVVVDGDEQEIEVDTRATKVMTTRIKAKYLSTTFVSSLQPLFPIFITNIMID